MKWIPLKRLCEGISQYGLNVPAASYTHTGVRFLRTSDIRPDGSIADDVAVYVDPSQVGENYKLVDGDLLFSRSGTLGRHLRYRRSMGEATFAGYLVRFRPSSEVSPDYLAYCAQARFFEQAIEADAISSTISNFNAEKYSQLRIPAWSFDEQRGIAKFLDDETARIDALIAKKRRMIELLNERHETWLRHEFRSLRAEALPLKRRWQVIDCKHRTPAYVPEGYPVVSPGDIAPGRLDLRRAHRFIDDADFADLTEGDRRPRRGDIIYSRNASIGIASYVDTDESFCMGQDVCLITSVDESQLYLAYALNSIGVDQLEVEKLGSTFNRINVAQILELRIPVPSVSEQRELADRFDRESKRVESLVAGLTKQRDLLAEHRQALITAAVSGELDVARHLAKASS